MKTAYRIITPILAVAAVVLGFFLKMFYFIFGSTDDQIGSLVNAISGLVSQFGGNNILNYEFSVFELIKMIAAAKPPESEEVGSFTEVAAPILPQLISFFVVFFLTVCVLIAIAVVSAALSDVKKRKRAVIGLSAAGLVLMFICILVSNSAFTKLIAGEVSLPDLMMLFSDNALMTLATAILSVTYASLSTGFYAMFGFFILMIIWTIFAGMIIKTPILKSKTFKRRTRVRNV